MKSIGIKWVLVGVFVASVASGQVDIPAAINYQGKLTNPSDGRPVASGVYHVEFRVWGHPTSTDGSYAEWGRSFPVHVVTNGLFNVLITDDGGELTSPAPLTNDLRQAFQGADRYLGLKITQGPSGSISAPEISPRQRLVSAPFAMHAQNSTEAYHAELADDAEHNFGIPGTLVVSGSTTLHGAADLHSLHVYSGGTQMDSGLNVEGNLSVASPSTISGHGITPIGGIIMWYGSVASIPDGWALCDGSSVNHHATPNLQNRFVVGVARTTGYSHGNTGGEERVTLTEGQMPKHHHAYTRYSEHYGYSASETWSHFWKSDKTVHTDYRGNNESHENRPPYYALCYIMRVK